MQELKLIYKENSDARSFVSEDFKYFYDKKTFTSAIWGKTEQDTPKFDPLCPEKAYIVLDDKAFIFDKDRIMKMFSLNTESNDPEFFASTLSEVVFQFGSHPENAFSKEVQKLKAFFEERHIFVQFELFSSDIKSLKDVMKLKTNKIENILLTIINPENAVDKVKMLLDGGVNVICSIYVRDDIDEFIKLIKQLPKVLQLRIEFSDYVSEDDKNTIVKAIIDNGIVDSSVYNVTEKSIGLKYSLNTMEYDSGLFSCKVDFTAGKISVGTEKPVRIDLSKVEWASDYWLSTAFKRYRNKIVKKIQ